MFTTIFVQPLANGLILFYNIFGHNLGLAIILFSVFLRFILNPLTKPYLESMKKIKEIAPQIEKIKEKFKGDNVKIAQAQAELYRQKKINPGAGCLPYLLQIVIFIAFFNVFTRTIYSSENLTEKFNNLLYPSLKFSQDYVINTKFLYLDITKPDIFKISGLPFPIPGPVVILAALVQFWSSKLMMGTTDVYKKKAKKTPEVSDDLQASIQQSMIYTFPLMTLFFGMSFPSGLALYWIVFSLIQFFQQYNANNKLATLLSKFSLIKSDTRNERTEKQKSKRNS
jgi:YidC/Oxa1 family membrane protein insertase